MGNAVYSANAGARDVALETQIKRFERSYRRRLRKLVRASSRLGDLLYTFPAAAFAMVSGRVTADRRGEAVRMVRDGQSLQKVGEVLDLANWMRRLPPEAFARPLGELPNSPRFGKQIANRVPKDERLAANWLQAIEAALEAGDEDFALWLAGQRIFDVPHFGESPVRPLAIFAWFSRQGDVRGRRLMEKPWHPKMRYGVAVEQMSLWFDRVVADLCRADVKRGPGRYSRRKKGRGYEFVPLRTASDLRGEGEAMANCVGTYVGAVAARECLIYSVRRGSHRVATLEVRWYGGARPVPYIAQLEGPGNTPADPVVLEATKDWLATQDNFVLASPAMVDRMSIDATRWKALWLPYVNAKGTKLLPLDRPDQRALARLLVDIERLHGNAGRR